MIQQVKISKIKKSDRKTDQRILQLLQESIKRVGLINPILLDEKYNIIDGKCRYEVCKQLGYKNIFANITTRPKIYEPIMKHKLTKKEQKDIVLELIERGLTVRQIATKTNHHPSTIYRWMK